MLYNCRVIDSTHIHMTLTLPKESADAQSRRRDQK